MAGALFGRWSVVGFPFCRWSVVIFGLADGQWFLWWVRAVVGGWLVMWSVIGVLHFYWSVVGIYF